MQDATRGATVRKVMTNTAALSWTVVVAVGLFVLVLVPSIHLPSRLDSGQELLDDAAPAFTEERVAGDRAGIAMVSAIVDLADPITTSEGGAAAEVPALVAFVSGQTGLSEPEVLDALSTSFPKTTALLGALPLSEVSAELPGLITFLSDAIGLPPAQINQAIAANFPRLARSIESLPTVTGGWNDVPGTDDLTRFDGTEVRTVPQVRDYFAADVIPVLERQQGNFRDLDSGVPKVGLITPILLLVGAIVVVFGAAMVARSWGGDRPAGETSAAWGVVVVVGVVVTALGAILFARLDGGQELLDDAAPAFTQERVAGDRAGINMVSAIVDLADPIVTAEGGAAVEVPALVAFVAGQTGLTEVEVRETLSASFPKTTALLTALPLSDVTAELPELVGFLSETLGLSPEELDQALTANFPRLAQAIENLPTVTNGWNAVPGTEDLTRFDGSEVRTVPQVRDYFAADVIPVLERQQGNFDKLATTAPPVDFFAPLLILVGILVVAYGAAMLAVARFSAPAFPHRPVNLRTA